MRYEGMSVKFRDGSASAVTRRPRPWWGLCFIFFAGANYTAGWILTSILIQFNSTRTAVRGDYAAFVSYHKYMMSVMY